MNVLTNLAGFTPHGFCLAWEPGLIWLMAVSDVLIALAYFSIPAALLVFLTRRKDVAFKPVFVLFAGFILFCGTTHLMGAVTLWVPAYRLDGLINAATAVLSVATAALLWPLIPRAVALPSPEKLRLLNQELAEQIALRDAAVLVMRANKQRLRQLYARSPAPLHATDARGIIFEVSDRWLELAGRRRDEVIGHTITEFYAPDHAASMLRQLEQFRHGHGARTGESVLLRGDGETRHVEMVFELDHASDGSLAGVLAALTDVTARRSSEAALKIAEEHLRQSQKMEAVGQLTGGIAHDFNNMLTSITGSLELLQQRPGLDERGMRLATNAIAGSRRAAKLTSQLLSFSRRQLLAPETLRPDLVVEGIYELLQRSLGERITLEVRPPAYDQWTMFADRNQTEAALINLVINARDAIEGDGRVTIEFGNLSVRRLAVTGEPAGERVLAGLQGRLADGDYCSIRVADTGMGMAPATLDRAFEPFFTTKPPGAGTGLGLSQTYGFATQSDGAVCVESAPGLGTSITILLPRARPVKLRVALEQGGPPASGRGERILFVEDDTSLRITMAEALEGRHFTIVSARDGRTALELIEGALELGKPFALLVTDVMMPGALTGVQLALAARKLQPDLTVMFATGYSDGLMFSDWNEAINLLPKPYSPDTLIRRIAQTLHEGTSDGMPPRQEVAG